MTVEARTDRGHSLREAGDIRRPWDPRERFHGEGSGSLDHVVRSRSDAEAGSGDDTRRRHHGDYTRDKEAHHDDRGSRRSVGILRDDKAANANGCVASHLVAVWCQ